MAHVSSAPLPPWTHTVRALLLAGLFLLTARCVDPVDPDVERRQVVTVAGVVTSGPGPHEVTLRRAGAFEQSLDAIREPLTRADVTITTGSGTTVVLREPRPELEPGTYTTRPGELVGTPGETYQLAFTLADGRRYRSTPQRMLPTPDLDTLLFRINEAGALVTEASVSDPDTTGNVYRWDLNGTWYYLSESGPCYLIDQNALSSLTLKTDRFVNGNTFQQIVRAFPTEDERLTYQYAMDVRMEALTPEVYRFWRTVRLQVENDGTTFSSPPARIPGNVARVDDPTDEALGLFYAADRKGRQRCITPDAFPEYDRPRPRRYRRCSSISIEGSSTYPGDLACPPISTPSPPTQPSPF
jgi:hypothetical protein